MAPRKGRLVSVSAKDIPKSGIISRAGQAVGAAFTAGSEALTGDVATPTPPQSLGNPIASPKTFGEMLGSTTGDEALTKQTERALDRIAKAAKRGAGSSKASKVANRLLERRLREYASLLTGKAPAAINFGTRLGKIKSLIREAAKAGKGLSHISLLSTGTLVESGAIRGELALERAAKIVTQHTAKVKGVTTGLTAAAKGATAGTVGRFLGGGLAKSILPFAGLYALDAIIKKVRGGEQDRTDIEKILNEGAGAQNEAFGPEQTLNFIQSMGPDFLRQVAADPALALALQEKLQSQATGSLPRGTAVLRSGGQTGGQDIQALLESLQSQ